MLMEHGFSFTASPREAEVILLNTCGFVDDAKEESIQAILALSAWKKKGDCRLLIVIGCLVQKYGAELEKALPEADMFFGVADWQPLLAYLKGYAVSPRQEPRRPRRLEVGDPEREVFCPSWSAAEKEGPAGYVKIAEGCSHRCTFCVIPQIRGRYRSRGLSSVVSEVSARVANGLREAVLVAQDTGAFGKDLMPPSSLAELISMLSAVEGLERIRIMYCYPEEVNDGLIEAMKHPKVCPYLDMPIQHIDDGVLRRMARPLGGGELKRVIRKLREHIPGIAIRTTLMVGFPGESEEAFHSLLDFLEEYHLERVGFFVFSPQPDTPAETMPDQIPAPVKERRLAAAQEKRDVLLAQWQDSHVGQVIRVMVDKETGHKGGRYEYEGRSCWDAPEIDGLVSFSGVGHFLPGQLASVRITHSKDYILSGEIANDFGK